MLDDPCPHTLFRTPDDGLVVIQLPDALIIDTSQSIGFEGEVLDASAVFELCGALAAWLLSLGPEVKV